MKTILTILLVIAVIAIVYIMFRKPSLLPQGDSKPLWEEIDFLKNANDSLKLDGIKKDSLLKTYKEDSLKIVARYEARIRGLENLPLDSIKVVSNHYIDTNLNEVEKNLAIAGLGFKLDECNEQGERQTLQITRLKARIVDFKLIAINEKEQNAVLVKITERDKTTIEYLENKLKKTKIYAIGVVVVVVVLSLLAGGA